MADALQGVRVVELGSGIPTAFAARLLGDLGAEVVKAEPPEGDPLRGAEPLLDDGTSLLFEQCNWGKRSVVGDGAGLLAGADVVIAPPDALPAPPAELLAAHPALTVTTVAGFGADGPWSGWAATDLILQATGGIMQISGTSDREPLKHGLQQSLWCGGLNAAYATLAAHLGGGGVHVDLSLQECIASELVLNEAHYAFVGAVQGRRPPAATRWPASRCPPPTGSCRCRRAASSRRSASRTSSATPASTIRASRARSRARTTPPSCRRSSPSTSPGSPAASSSCAPRARGTSAAASRRRSDLLCLPPAGGARGVARVRRPARRALPRHDRVPVGHAAAGPRTGPEPRRRPPDWTPRSPRERRETPLAGLRVVDLSTVFAVPYMGALLSDLGAEVIKVEAPHRLDQTRALFGHPFLDNAPTGNWWDRSGAFHVVNRGKRSLTLDLSQAEGREVLLDLLGETDVLLDNFTPRVLRGWGMTAADLHARHPRLLTLSNTGYGSTGPWAAFRAQGTSLEATMGISHLTGYRDGRPAKVGQSYPDFVACWSGLVALLAALVHRERTGEGQHIDLGMYQLGVVVMPEAVLHLQAHGEELSRRGNEDLAAFASGLVPARGDDRWLAVSIPSAEAFTRAMRVAPGADPMAVVAAWARDRDAAAAAAELQAAGIPRVPCSTRATCSRASTCARGGSTRRSMSARAAARARSSAGPTGSRARTSGDRRPRSGRR